uniref:Uncharacterized protein n=1 Tax=Anguilla anguilla TaxID=7936 RepID=A0A0E9PGA3_ANGAN
MDRPTDSPRGHYSFAILVRTVVATVNEIW